MNKFLWIIGAPALGVAAYLLLTDDGSAQTADGLDEFGARAGGWGTRNRITGTGGALGGKLKQGFGKLTGDEQTESEGYVDEAVGNVKDAAGKAAQGVSDVVSDLNR